MTLSLGSHKGWGVRVHNLIPSRVLINVNYQPSFCLMLLVSS